ncbi:DUF4402 domain-containing protein [Allopontixanthobacter sp.]|uniref:DUF4402 domain-containing protein n=1 Tax=Allopontixanthobacter sp. TaxID=2906452 RepID=UPI002ABAAD1F|nr:DUF4402 domain-containing protein [Allopontixanthobacter sp.]MDZ4308472.1 DUF4402 domain-containing protein [Allopontixanthobacter sp.]
MKKFLRFGAASAVVAASLGMSTVAHAQDSAQADAFAEILTALTLELDTGSSLDFGAMVITGAGTVSLDAATGTLDCSAAAIVCSGTTELAAFSITTGTALKNVTIVFDTPTATLLRAGGTIGDAADELELSNLNSDAALVADPLGDFYQVALDGVGTAGFLVGGDLAFDGSEVAGVYQGTFTVSVEYT